MPPKKMKMKPILWSSVPDEVFYEILLRLPVKSLCRFKCVSKSWFSVISDPKFISAHFDHSLANPKVLLISVPKFKGDLFSELFCSVDYTEWGNRMWGNRPQSLIANYHGQIFHKSIYSRFSQSVGGLSLVISGNSLLICNPSTRESINLPPCPGNSHFCLSTSSHNSYLGFDPIENKYKVLSSWRSSIDLRSKSKDCGNYVLTLGEEAWRSVDCKYSPGSGGALKWTLKDFEFDSAGICVNGVIYYIYRDADHDTLDLVAFDVRSETFRSMSLPAGNALELVRPTFLMEYEGCVAVVYMEIRRDHICDYGYLVIVMNILSDISDEEWEWTIDEHFVREELNHLVCVDNLVGSSPSGELVFVSHCSSDLIILNCYDVETECMKEIRVRAPKDRKSTWSCLATKISPARVFGHAERLESLQGLSGTTYQYQRH